MCNDNLSAFSAVLSCPPISRQEYVSADYGSQLENASFAARETATQQMWQKGNGSIRKVIPRKNLLSGEKSMERETPGTEKPVEERRDDAELQTLQFSPNNSFS